MPEKPKELHRLECESFPSAFFFFLNFNVGYRMREGAVRIRDI